MSYHVLVTDYAWSSLDLERRILGAAGAQLVVAETGTERELLALAPAADAILTCWKKVSPAVLDAAPHCRVVARYGIGLDNIAVDRATELGILVTNVPGFCVEEVSDHAMALLLACARRIPTYTRFTRAGTWDVMVGRPIHRLRGRALGLIGYGSIARSLVPKALGFGLQIVVYDPALPADGLAPFGRVAMTLDALLTEADFVSIHVPLTLETCGLINERALRAMRPTSYLINTSRGPVIDEPALVRALTEGWIAGAGLDVLSVEPPPAANPLLQLDNVIVTPHAAFYSEESIEDLQIEAATQVAQALQGEVPSHVVNPSVLDQPNCRLAAPKEGLKDG